ncbi:MAG: ABC transporter permease [Dehalococcoidia bacterium]|jgi:ABC-2 type transport system permease protein|nr:ABC transporter permease [Dehalococcoidia bacterium]
MTPLHASWLVALREINERARTRTFAISTGLIVLLSASGVLAGALLPDFFEDDPPLIAVVESDLPPGLATLLEDGSLGATADIHRVPSTEEAQRLVQDGTADAAIYAGPTIAFRNETSSSTFNLITQAYRLAALPAVLDQLDLTLEQALPLISPDPVPVTLLDPPDTPEPDDAQSGIATISVVAVLMTLTIYGVWILNGVIEEKTSRVVEVLMGAIRPWQLLLGKVCGILALALAQIAAAAGTATLLLVLVRDADLPDVTGEVAAFAIVYAVLGLLLYSFVYAAAGATVSRQEEAQSVTMPITFTLLGVYMLSLIVVIQNPDSTVARVVSIIPFSSPLTMTPRIAVSDPPLWEIALSLTLLLITIPLVIRLAGRIYTGAILRTGPRIGIRDAWRSARETN